jgi:hypothetical protein
MSEGKREFLSGPAPSRPTVALAGGEGETLRPLTERWLGCHKTKHFCTFFVQVLLERETLDRETLATILGHKKDAALCLT